jgi:hypothetical protein
MRRGDRREAPGGLGGKAVALRIAGEPQIGHGNVHALFRGQKPLERATKLAGAKKRRVFFLL